MNDVAMENDGAGHIHVWERESGSCVCGGSVPAWLAMAWARFDPPARRR